MTHRSAHIRTLGNTFVGDGVRTERSRLLGGLWYQLVLQHKLRQLKEKKIGPKAESEDERQEVKEISRLTAYQRTEEEKWSLRKEKDSKTENPEEGPLCFAIKRG